MVLQFFESLFTALNQKELDDYFRLFRVQGFLFIPLTFLDLETLLDRFNYSDADAMIMISKTQKNSTLQVP